MPTRYGRVGFRMQAAAVKGSGNDLCVVHASLTLPSSFVGSSGPAGGVYLRLRAPLHCGEMVAVSVGAAAWTAFDPTAEAILFDAAAITPNLLKRVESIEATFR